mgnify:CR=1 FL=1
MGARLKKVCLLLALTLSVSTLTSLDAATAATFYLGDGTTDADSETVTFTPAGVMPAQGVAAATLTAKTTGYGVEDSLKTVLASPTVASVVAAGAAFGASELAALFNASLRFKLGRVPNTAA